MASTLVVCPYCNARLRLAGAVGAGTRAKCRVCKKGFTPTVAMAPAAAADGPAPPPAAPPAFAEPPPDAAGPVDPAAPAHAPHRKRERIADEDHRKLKPYELALAATLLLGLAAGLGAYGWYLYRTEFAPPPADGGSAADDGPAAAPRAPLLAAAAKPLPPGLFGRWELKSDDGTLGWMDLRPDGTLTAFASSPETPPLDPYEGVWALADEDGDRYVLDLGPAGGGLGQHRIALDFYEPHAFTLVETVFQGIPNWETRRFVRPAAADPPP